MTYVDGFLLAVPTANKEAYRKMAEDAWTVFKKHGALRQVECWADDVPEGKVTSFSIALQRKPEETAMFSWIEWPSKEARDKGNAAAMEDFNAKGFTPDMLPFDGKRMFWGGFQPIIDERR